METEDILSIAGLLIIAVAILGYRMGYMTKAYGVTSEDFPFKRKQVWKLVDILVGTAEGNHYYVFKKHLDHEKYSDEVVISDFKKSGFDDFSIGSHYRITKSVRGDLLYDKKVIYPLS